MKYMWTMSPSRNQRGFSIPAAIFIIVILAALGAFLATIGSSQHLGYAQDVTGAHALQAARAGVEWGVYQVIDHTPNPNPVTFPTVFASACRTAGSSSGNITYTSANGQTFSVLIECRSSGPFYDGSTTPLYSYQLTATACNDSASCPNVVNPGNLYVERRVTTLVTN